MPEKQKFKIGDNLRSVGGGAYNLVKDPKSITARQITVFAVIAVLILVAVFYGATIRSYIAEFDKEQEYNEIKESHTSEPCTVLPVTWGFTFKVPAESETIGEYDGDGWGRDNSYVTAYFYDNDPDIGGFKEKTMVYNMITDQDYARDVADNIKRPGMTGLTQVDIQDRTKGKIWTNNEQPEQPYVENPREGEFSLKVQVVYMDRDGEASGDILNFALTVDHYWSTDFSQNEAIPDWFYAWDQTYIYVPIDPELRYTEIQITVTGQVKETWDEAGWFGDFEQANPDFDGPITDYKLETEAGNVVQPITYYYPLKYQNA